MVWMPHLQIGLKLKILEGGVWIRRKQTDKEKGEKRLLNVGLFREVEGKAQILSACGATYVR